MDEEDVDEPLDLRMDSLQKEVKYGFVPPSEIVDAESLSHSASYFLSHSFIHCIWSSIDGDEIMDEPVW